MMAATRTMQQPINFARLFKRKTLSWQALLVSTLIFSVMSSAVAVIYIRCTERQLVSEEQALVQQQQQLQVTWGQLLLEQSTWSNPVHIQDVAYSDDMVSPQQKSIVMVKM